MRLGRAVMGAGTQVLYWPQWPVAVVLIFLAHGFRRMRGVDTTEDLTAFFQLLYSLCINGLLRLTIAPPVPQIAILKKESREKNESCLSLVTVD